METQLPLEYIIKESTKKSKNTPVIFMLHGYGSNEQDLFSFANELPEQYTIISLRAPYKLSDFGYAWYAIDFDADKGKWSDNKQAMESRDLIVNFIEEACKAHKLDAKNVTLLGFSQGCILSLVVALSYPQKIKNVIGLSGYLNKDILKQDFEKQNFTGLNIYVSHGASDQIIPVEWARATAPELQRLHINLVYEEFPVGHGVSPQNFYSFRDWLKSKS
ncbi:alpha/beta hydrolase [Capnocytophaga canimorsus]|uniref:alpha/beta hydrolase n=1 Tax=Capnocytophaga canimorsus TaxID=28188 RepID=UPI000D6E2E7A|nr:alpha/beta fold hydrolase [Capnocytophaga canimorsus]AWL77718.1 phospholipase [Capnocytophaga canimorsus]AYW36261.1 alpha/beta fold hydrolase [Capnocytophaga canimorsus]MDT9500340.1 alpha/beta fold hydrolase [Capnocytophaga canimorsus]